MLSAPSGAGIVVQDVSYSLPNGHGALKPVSLQIRPGQRIALCGESGSGKSLLLDMLFGLREPTTGSISINGIDPRDLRPDVLRRHVGLARDVEVFDGTVAENVHLERPDISIGDVRTALEVVGLLPHIQKLPQGLDTPLCSDGTPLTGSQLRRLMIARVIAARPQIVLIDETLDSLSDEEAERIMRRILSADQSWTIVLVTSRKGLISMMDSVVSLTPSVELEEHAGSVSRD
jgi:ABC-type multidrug transport system fused ATPase/permease subunit